MHLDATVVLEPVVSKQGPVCEGPGQIRAPPVRSNLRLKVSNLSVRSATCLKTHIDALSSRLVCASVVAGGESMPATARVTETPIETLPVEERIRRRAYELYVQRGSESGSELDDWLQAEEEIQRAAEEALE